MFLPDVSWELPMVDLGEGPGGPGPPLILVKKNKNHRRKKRQQGKQQKKPAPPPLTQGLDPPLTANN